MGDQNAHHVLIIGAGITGLIIAQGLKEANIPYSIFESDVDPQGRRRGNWGMGCHWSLPLLAQVLPAHIFSRLQADAAVDPWYDPPDQDKMQIINGETGETIHNIPLPKMYRFARQRFRKLLAEGVDVQYNKRLHTIEFGPEGSNDVNAEKDVTAIFTDGSTATGTILVGCDGARSIVRRHILPLNDDAVEIRAPYTGVRTLVKYRTAEQALKVKTLNPIASIAVHPLGIFAFITVLDVPDKDKPEDWTFQLMTTWPKPSKDSSSVPKDESVEMKAGSGADTELINQLREKMSHFGGIYGLANKWAFEEPVSVTYERINISYWVPDDKSKNWDNRGGRMTLVGDAAHPMTFHRGQGLNHAVTDSVHFVNAMKTLATEKSGSALRLKEEIAKYEEEMRERGGKEVEVSKQNSEMLHDWEKLMQSPIVQRGIKVKDAD